MNLKTLTKDLRLAKTILFKHPYKCIVQVTNRCNMKCSFCDFWPNGVPSSQELSLDDYRKLADELASLGCFIVSIEGGEPLVRSDIVEIVRIFAKKHVPILFTNGWYVDEKIAHDFFQAGLAQIGVSIDYPDAKRHDAKRGLEGGFERAWKAVGLLKKAALNGGKQVYVMTVLMKENQEDVEAMLQLTAPLGIGHTFTLLSDKGFRRTSADQPPDAPISERLLELHGRYPHLKVFRKYLELIDPYLKGGTMPACHAGEQSFNIDHVGNVAPCIEKIDHPYGNLREEPLSQILGRMRNLPEVSGCQDCWTLCRGFSQCLDGRGDLKSWQDLGGRMRTS